MAQDASVTASVDRTTIRENESFMYTLRAEGRVSGQPDPSPLEADFDIINRSSSTRIQLLNGRTEQVGEWMFQLIPRRSGEITLPGLRVGNVMSNPVEIEVQPAPTAAADGDAEADIFMEVSLDPAVAYVQAQAVYTLRLFIGVGTGRRTLTAPPITGGEAIVEKLGEDTQYQTVRGNKQFIVYERRYAIFPQQAGRLTVGPATFEVMVIPNRGFTRVQRLRSDSVDLEVKAAVPPPASHPDAAWLPARHLTLSDRWADTAGGFTLGVPRTRVLTIEADGLLETQLPELDIDAAAGIRQYPDQPELERDVTDTGLSVRRVERYAVIAQTEGEVSIPAAEVPWWNVVEERWEVARVEPQALVVASSNEPAVEPPPEPAAATAPTPVPLSPGYWPWVSASLAAGWLLTVLLWLRTHRSARRPRGGRAEAAARAPSGRNLFKQLRAACAVNDAQRVQQLLLEWARLQYTDDPPQSLGALIERLPRPLAGEAAALEAHLYGRQDNSWDGRELGRLLGAVNSVAKPGDKPDSDPLVPLYR
jgi:hypothetical protein